MRIELCSSLPSWMTQKEFSDVLQQTGKALDYFITDTSENLNRTFNLECIVYDNAETQCHVTQVAESIYEIFVPIGFIEKTALLHLIASRHSLCDPLRIIQSPLDRSRIPAYIPTILHPLFDRTNRASKDSVDKIRAEFSNDVSPDFPPFTETISSSLNFLVGHEFSHISLSHFQFQSEYLGTKSICTVDSIGFTEYEIKQGLEVCADLEAARLCINNFWNNLNLNEETTNKKIILDLSSLIFGMTIAVCLFDSQKRHLDDEALSYYPHPLIRLSMIWDLFESYTPDDNWKKLIDELFVLSSTWIESGIARAYVYGVSKDHFPNNDAMKRAFCIPLSSLTRDLNPFFVSILEEFKEVSYQRGVRASLQVKNMKEPLARISLDLANETNEKYLAYQDKILLEISEEAKIGQD